MVELRRSPRINVTWRGVLKANDGNLLPIRVLNVSSTGLLIQSAVALKMNAEYQTMLEIPHISHEVKAQLYKVPAKILILHSVLTGEYFRVGVRFTEIAEIHKDLVAAWISLASKYEP
jgi:c-di-GMP-binding flagellar brake protein YcgR